MTFGFDVPMTIYVNFKDTNDVVELDLNSRGYVFARSQVMDYQNRGEELDQYNVLDFFVDTYEDDIDKKDRRSDDSEDDDTIRHSGRLRHSCIRYLPLHPKYEQKYRIVRQQRHRNLPNFVGRYFPNRDNSKTADLYSACMLILLKPWRDMTRDLRTDSQSWTDAWTSFLANAPKDIHDIVSGIQYYHDCDRAATESRATETDIQGFSNNDADSVGYREDNDVEYVDADEDVHDNEYELMEERLEEMIATQTPLREQFHGQLAIEVARQAKIFPSTETGWLVSPDNQTRNAEAGDLGWLMSWKAQMQQDVATQNTNDSMTDDNNGPHNDEAMVDVLDFPEQSQTKEGAADGEILMLAPEAPIPCLDPVKLNVKQHQAYDIITDHLRDTLANKNPPPLRMILYGAGGTGKSKVIQTVTDAFLKSGARIEIMI